MPVFFVTYGFVCATRMAKQNEPFSLSFVFKKFKRLMVPYYIWAFTYTVFTKNLTWKTALLILWGSQTGLKMAGSLTSLWFLPCMFMSTCIFQILVCISSKYKNRIASLLLVLSTAILSLVLPKFEYGYFCGTDAALMGTLFSLIGLYAAPVFKTIRKKNNYIKLIIAIVCIVLCTLLNHYNLQYIPINNADMPSGNYGLVYIYIMAAIMGNVSIIVISMLLENMDNLWVRNNIIKMGQNTLIVLVLHKPLVTWLSNEVAVVGFGNMLSCLVVSLVVCCFASFFSEPIKHYIPWSVGNL